MYCRVHFWAANGAESWNIRSRILQQTQEDREVIKAYNFSFSVFLILCTGYIYIPKTHVYFLHTYKKKPQENKHHCLKHRTIFTLIHIFAFRCYNERSRWCPLNKQKVEVMDPLPPTHIYMYINLCVYALRCMKMNVCMCVYTQVLFIQIHMVWNRYFWEITSCC